MGICISHKIIPQLQNIDFDDIQSCDDNSDNSDDLDEEYYIESVKSNRSSNSRRSKRSLRTISTETIKPKETYPKLKTIKTAYSLKINKVSRKRTNSF